MATTFTNKDFTHAEQATLVWWAVEFQYPDEHGGVRDALHDIGVTGAIWWLSSRRGWHMLLDISHDTVSMTLKHGEAEWVRRDLAEYRLRV